MLESGSLTTTVVDFTTTVVNLKIMKKAITIF